MPRRSRVIGMQGTTSSESGYVTRFQVRAAFLERYERQIVGGSIHEELWIPAEELPLLNQNIVGMIEVITEFHAEEHG